MSPPPQLPESPTVPLRRLRSSIKHELIVIRVSHVRNFARSSNDAIATNARISESCTASCASSTFPITRRATRSIRLRCSRHNSPNASLSPRFASATRRTSLRIGPSPPAFDAENVRAIRSLGRVANGFLEFIIRLQIFQLRLQQRGLRFQLVCRRRIHLRPQRLALLELLRGYAVRFSA